MSENVPKETNTQFNDDLCYSTGGGCAGMDRSAPLATGANVGQQGANADGLSANALVLLVGELLLMDC